MSTPTARRRHRRGPDHTFLAGLAGTVDEATADAPGHVLVRVEGPVRPRSDLGLRPIEEGVHPFELLAGFVAPEQWTVFGLRTTGRARRFDEPTAIGERVASTFLVDREAREASVLRFDGEVADTPGRASGTIPDLCRRVLGQPTDPAPPTTALLWAARWLDRITDRWGQPDRRRDLLAGWPQVAVLHPAVGEPAPPDVLTVADPGSLVRVGQAHAAATTWREVRQRDAPLELPDGPLDPGIARWMDDGFFARWTIGAHPPLAATASELRGLLGEPLGSMLLEALAGLLEE